MKGTFALLLLTSVCTYGQFKGNSIGVVYLTNESADTYSLTIAFPIQTLEKSIPETNDARLTIGTLNYRGQITLFDKYGDLLTMIPKTYFLVQLWCENDGGIQYRPILKTSIKKILFKRKIKAVNEIQNIACFAIANRNEQKLGRPNLKTSNNIQLEGDYNNDGQIDCFLLTYHDEAENCDGEPKNQLGIILQIGSKEFRLRCCGP